MPKMLAAAHHEYGGPKSTCGCCFVNPGARTKEKREWSREAKNGIWEYKFEADRIDCECGAC